MHWRSQGTPPPTLKFSKIISVKQSITNMEEKRKRKMRLLFESDSDKKKEREKKFSHTKLCFCLVLRETCIYFIIFYFISLFTLFLLFTILFKAFYP